MFRFVKNHIQGACFALLKLLVLFHYFERCGSMHQVTPEAICDCVFLTAAFGTIGIKRSSKEHTTTSSFWRNLMHAVTPLEIVKNL